ncbi:MAG: polysaccharide pyruvyl transferase CsaB [Firmicutes bacterium]|nr:polysaccharide pyruvyl transferase CsaB [Bacillota bacterium]
MKRFVISGYYGFANTGDEAILAAIIQHIREIEPDADFVVISADPASTRREHSVRAVARNDLPSIVRELAGADLLISGGGGLLQDATSSRSIPYYLGIVLLAKMLRVKVFFYAQGVGPIRGRLGRYLVRLIGNMVDSITVRDEASCSLLKELGVRRPMIRVVADPVLGLAVPRFPPGPQAQSSGASQVFENEGNTRLYPAGRPAAPVIGIVVRRWKSFARYQDAIVEFACELYRRAGARFLFIPFHYPGDLELSRELAQRIRGAISGAGGVGEACGSGEIGGTGAGIDLGIIEEYRGPEAVLAAIQGVDLLVGMRFHSLVFAALVGTPFVAISYDQKVDSFLSLLGEEKAGDVENINKMCLVDRTMEILMRGTGRGTALAERARALGMKAREAARLAVELIETPSRSWAAP